VFNLKAAKRVNVSEKGGEARTAGKVGAA